MSTKIKIKPSILNKISACFKLYPNQEACGFIVEDNNVLDFIECENLANNKRDFFVVDPFVFAENNVVTVVHSHWQGSSTPSGLDKKIADDFDLPFLIYSIIDDDFCLYENKSVTKIKV